MKYVIYLSIAALMCAAHAQAWAQKHDSWSLQAGVSTFFDDNLFRRDTGLEVDDQITSTFVGLNLDKAWSRQRVVVNANLSNNRYRENDQLDYPGKDLDAAWHWGVTARLKGKLSARYQETINSFEDFSRTSKNIRTTQNYLFEMEWGVVGHWSMLAGVGKYDRENSEIFLAESDYGSDSVELGVKYTTLADNYLALVFRKAKGHYDNREINASLGIDSGFDDQRLEARFLWLLSGRSRFFGNLGYEERVHENVGARDFQGVVGDLNYRWQFNDNLRFDVGFQQDLISYQSSPISDTYLVLNGSAFYNSSFYRLRRFELAPVWQLSDRMGLSARYRHDNRLFQGGFIDEIPGFGALEDRDDDIDSLLIQLVWAPYDPLQVAFTLQEDKRNSNRTRADYVSRMASARLTLVF